MKTEVFVGTHHLKESLLSPPKAISEHLVSILLLDTPQNTPVGSPQSDIATEEPEALPSTSDVPSTSAIRPSTTSPQAQPIRIPKKKKKNRRKRPEYFYDEMFSDSFEETQEILGAGAYAMVKVCIDKKTREEYAVKIISKDKPGHTCRRAYRELETFHTCRHHNNIVKLVNFFEEVDRFLMVFEKVIGGPLLYHIENMGSFNEREASMIMRDLADALTFLHSKGIAHRDLKPENILCCLKEQPYPVKICDFDLATAVVYKKSTSTPISSPELTSPVGSPEFMAPEIVQGFVGNATTYDKRCDLWSLGVVMYILLCGYPPFYGNCGENCGWETGQSCEACRANLFNMIQEGIYSFPDREWRHISYAAKELIGHLLVIDASQRYSAKTVLEHPWVANGDPTKFLGTPCIIKRNASAKSLSEFTEDANCYKRSPGRTECESTDETSSLSSVRDSSFEVSPIDTSFNMANEMGNLYLSDHDKPEE